MMKLKELKKKLAEVAAKEVRFGGFCDDYTLLPTQYQIGISDTGKTICLIDSPDISGIEGEVYDQMTILSKLLSLPETYNDYELFLSGVEDASEHSTSIVVKNINTVRILNTPGDESQIGICLLGPVRNPDTTSVYYTEIVIEDEKALELVKSDEFVSLLDAYFPTLNGYDHLYYLDDENGKLTINSYSDQAHSDMFLAMLDGQYSGVYFQRTCLDGTESVYFTNDVKSKYWKQYFLKITFADTRDCQTKCGTHVRCSDNGEYYISMMFETESEREEFIKTHIDEIQEGVGDKIYKWNKKVISDITQFIIGI
jgi:hypothetical protein